MTGQENLKRHSEVHSKKSNEPALKCSHCSKTFSRQDLRLRHVRRKHPQLAFSSAGEPSGRTRSVGPSQAVPDHASTSDVSDNGASPHRAAYSGNTGQETRPAEFDIGRVWDVAMPQELSITLGASHPVRLVTDVSRARRFLGICSAIARYDGRGC